MATDKTATNKRSVLQKGELFQWLYFLERFVLLPPICSPSILHTVLKNQPAAGKCVGDDKGDTMDCAKLASSIFAILTFLFGICEPALFRTIPRGTKNNLFFTFLWWMHFYPETQGGRECSCSDSSSGAVLLFKCTVVKSCNSQASVIQWFCLSCLSLREGFIPSYETKYSTGYCF